MHYFVTDLIEVIPCTMKYDIQTSHQYTYIDQSEDVIIIIIIIYLLQYTDKLI